MHTSHCCRVSCIFTVCIDNTQVYHEPSRAPFFFYNVLVIVACLCSRIKHYSDVICVNLLSRNKQLQQMRLYTQIQCIYILRTHVYMSVRSDGGLIRKWDRKLATGNDLMTSSFVEILISSRLEKNNMQICRIAQTTCEHVNTIIATCKWPCVNIPGAQYFLFNCQIENWFLDRFDYFVISSCMYRVLEKCQ